MQQTKLEPEMKRNLHIQLGETLAMALVHGFAPRTRAYAEDRFVSGSMNTA